MDVYVFCVVVVDVVVFDVSCGDVRDVGLVEC